MPSQNKIEQTIYWWVIKKTSTNFSFFPIFLVLFSITILLSIQFHLDIVEVVNFEEFSKKNERKKILNLIFKNPTIKKYSEIHEYFSKITKYWRKLWNTTH